MCCAPLQGPIIAEHAAGYGYPHLAGLLCNSMLEQKSLSLLCLLRKTLFGLMPRCGNVATRDCIVSNAKQGPSFFVMGVCVPLRAIQCCKEARIYGTKRETDKLHECIAVEGRRAHLCTEQAQLRALCCGALPNLLQCRQPVLLYVPKQLERLHACHHCATSDTQMAT